MRAEELRPRLVALNQRLGAWQQQMAEQINLEFARLRQARQLEDPARQQEAARLALGRVGDGPRRELNAAVDELCVLYLKSDAAERAALRVLVHEQEYIIHDLWGYLRRAAEQVRAGGGEPWLRLGLAVVAIEDLATDLEDTRDGLAELYHSAQQQNIDVDAVFREVSAVASGACRAGREISTSELLATFHPPR